MTAFADWLASYASTLDDAGLERWCGAALLARGRADAAAGTATLEVTRDRAIVRVGDNTVELGRDGLAASTCTCPARSCRHRVVAALAVRAHHANTTPPPAPSAPAPALDDETARAKFGARLWKRARTAIERGVIVELVESAAELTATFAGTGVSCAFPSQLPLESSICSCRKPFPCEHRAIAIAAQLAGVARPPAPAIPAESLERIAALCHELVDTGLDHAHAGWVRAAIRLAVVAHAVGLPRLERELEDLADRLELARRRSARFDLRTTAIAIARIALRARLLATQPRSHELVGTFQRTYLETGAVELACLGAQLFTTADASDGVRLYFYDGVRFATATTIIERERETGGDPWRSRRIRFDRPLWGAARWQQLLGARLRVDNARRSTDGAIATSNATRATVHDRFDPCTLELGALRTDDWRPLATRIAATEPFPFGDPPAPITVVLVPHAITGAHRDPLRKAIVAELHDTAGRTMRLELAARRANEPAQRHALARLLDAPPAQILATIQLERGALVATPIAFYRPGAPIAIFGLEDVPPRDAVGHAAPASAAPLDPVWRWLELLVAAGRVTAGSIHVPASPVASLANFLAAAPRDPRALLDAIAATAIADEVEARHNLTDPQS